jgi:alkylated DNA repair dioxygenase AlkB
MKLILEFGLMNLIEELNNMVFIIVIQLGKLMLMQIQYFVVQRIVSVCQPVFNQLHVQLGFPGGNIQQVLVNEYTSGQGITPHIDHIKNFGPVVMTLTLGDPSPMHFTTPGSSRYTIVPIHGTVAAMTGESRYKWKHEIAKMKPDKRRVSVTFRSVISV